MLITDSDGVEHGHRRPGRVPAREAGEPSGTDHIVKHAQVWEESWGAAQPTNGTAELRAVHPTKVHAVHPHLPSIGLIESHQKPKERLAGRAGGAEQNRGDIGRQFGGDIVDQYHTSR